MSALTKGRLIVTEEKEEAQGTPMTEVSVFDCEPMLKLKPLSSPSCPLKVPENFMVLFSPGAKSPRSHELFLEKVFGSERVKAKPKGYSTLKSKSFATVGELEVTSTL